METAWLYAYVLRHTSADCMRSVIKAEITLLHHPKFVFYYNYRKPAYLNLTSLPSHGENNAQLMFKMTLHIIHWNGPLTRCPKLRSDIK